MADPQYDRRLYTFLRTPAPFAKLSPLFLESWQRVKKMKSLISLSAYLDDFTDVEHLGKILADLLATGLVTSVNNETQRISDQSKKNLKEFIKVKQAYIWSFKEHNSQSITLKKDRGQKLENLFCSESSFTYQNALRMWQPQCLLIEMYRKCTVLDQRFTFFKEVQQTIEGIHKQEESKRQKLKSSARHSCSADKRKQQLVISTEEMFDRKDLEEEYQQFFKQIEEDRKRAREELPWNAFLVIPDEVVTEGPVVSLVPKTEKVGTSDPRFKRLQDITQNRVDITKDDVVSALTDFGTLGDNPDGTKTYSIWGESGGFYLGYFTLPSDEPQASSESNWRNNVVDLFRRAGYF